MTRNSGLHPPGDLASTQVALLTLPLGSISESILSGKPHQVRKFTPGPWTRRSRASWPSFKLRLAFLGVVGTAAALVLIYFGLLVSSLVFHREGEARPESTQVYLSGLGIELDDFRKVCGTYPTSEQGLAALVAKPKDLGCKNYTPFIQNPDSPSLFKDGWGEQIRYTSDGKKYRLEASHGITKEGP